ncbi:hypothetical protein D3C83_257040 [compost metagenome]
MPQSILAFSPEPVPGTIVNACLFEASPFDKSAQKKTGLIQVSQCIDNLPVQQAEVGNTIVKVDVR